MKAEMATTMGFNRMEFIYVYGDQYRDQLLLMGYQLLKADPRGNIYVFHVGRDALFSAESSLDEAGIPYITSNVLTF